MTVPQDDRWGRAYEGYSEDPRLVASYAGEFVKGLQGDPASPDFLKGPHVISSTKHYLADGGTENGRDQGDAKIPETDLRQDPQRGLRAGHRERRADHHDFLLELERREA